MIIHFYHSSSSEEIQKLTEQLSDEKDNVTRLEQQLVQIENDKKDIGKY